jgi:hypothetical protein
MSNIGHEAKAPMKRRRWGNRGGSGNRVEAMGNQGGSGNGGIEREVKGVRLCR